MAVQVTNLQNDRTIEVATTGKLTRADYDEFVPVIESEMKKGKVKILFSMHDFSGWDVSALWEDIKFDMKHFGEIDALPWLVKRNGSKAWHGFVSRLRRQKLLTSIKVKSTQHAPGYRVNNSSLGLLRMTRIIFDDTY